MKDEGLLVKRLKVLAVDGARYTGLPRQLGRVEVDLGAAPNNKNRFNLVCWGGVGGGSCHRKRHYTLDHDVSS